MSLRLYYNTESIPEGTEIIKDIDGAFAALSIPNTEVGKRLLKEIEKGTYVDEQSFVDRFGYKLWKENMSTGCKAALLVGILNDCVIDTEECGLNARDSIVTFCTEGAILIEYDDVTFQDYELHKETDIDVICDGYTFKTIYDLNRYLQEV